MINRDETFFAAVQRWKDMTDMQRQLLRTLERAPDLTGVDPDGVTQVSIVALPGGYTARELDSEVCDDWGLS